MHFRFIAQSLGTVVTYHAMARLPRAASERLFTIGSPLEKVRFLWTKLFPRGSIRAEVAIGLPAVEGSIALAGSSAAGQ